MSAGLAFMNGIEISARAGTIVSDARPSTYSLSIVPIVKALRLFKLLMSKLDLE